MTEVGSGICHCGMDMEDHTGWENHAATEMMYKCMSTYTVGGDIVLRCTGEHLKGNPFRDGGVVHQAPTMGASWTWYTSEEDK